MPPINYKKIKNRRKKAADRRKEFQERVARGEVADEYKTIYPDVPRGTKEDKRRETT